MLLVVGGQSPASEAAADATQARCSADGAQVDRTAMKEITMYGWIGRVRSHPGSQRPYKGRFPPTNHGHGSFVRPRDPRSIVEQVAYLLAASFRQKKSLQARRAAAARDVLGQL